MRSPIAAILWENWRVSRVEAAQRLAFGIVAAWAALTLLPADKGLTAAFVILIIVHSMIWFSIAKLNGGRFMDGYKPGFPFYLLYSRPVPTATFVAVTMLYDAVTCTALYVASAAVLEWAFGHALPGFSMALCLVVYHFAYACCQWSTRQRTVQWIGSMLFSVPMIFFLKSNLRFPLRVEFSVADNAVLVLVGVACFALTVAGVARQRRGDALATAPQRKAVSGGYPEWLIGMFRLSCPTSSATKAQVWFELKASGLPTIAVGMAIALLFFLAFVFFAPLETFRNVALPIALFSMIIVLFGLGNNAFGIRRKQGRTYASSFESTLPCGTAQLASLKVVVRTACVLVALTAIGASVWGSSYLLDSWGWQPGGTQDALPELLTLRRKIQGEFASLSGYAHVALAVVACIVVAASVAWQASREALRARSPRLLLVWQWLPPLWTLAFILLAVAEKHGIATPFTSRAFFVASFWISGAAMALGAIYTLWGEVAGGILTVRQACGAMLVPAAFGIAWFTGMPAPSISGMLWMVLSILIVCLLAPWSLSRARHT